MTANLAEIGRAVAQELIEGLSGTKLTLEQIGAIAVRALRDPSEGMNAAGADAMYDGPLSARTIYQAMVDALLSESPG